MAGAAASRARAAEKPLNILLITVDDMSCDSIGVFGCEVPGTTPAIDKLATESIRFEYAHMQVANCYPSRNVMQTGRYPHTSGVEGFYKVKVDFPILPDLMREHGYFIGIKGKVAHSTPDTPYPWDVQTDEGKKTASTYGAFTKDAIAQSQAANKPFYLLVNISDPHLPFYAMGKGGVTVPDKDVPSRVYTPDEIAVPGYLPDLPITRKELSHYYSSVRRADDCVAETLQALDASGEAENTAILFLSDHGMPFPFAKTNVYHHSTRTPWMVRWPGTVEPGSVDKKHMISAIDFMPTVLDMAGIDVPRGPQGRSIVPILKGETQEGRDFVIKEYNENAGAGRHPMRSIQTRRFCYIFNPWSNGERGFKTATQGMATYKEMQRLAPEDAEIAERLRVFDLRDVEELYDTKKDADALRNLINDPEYAKELERLRATLAQWMKETDDDCLEAFEMRGDPEAINAYVEKKQAEATERRSKKRRANNTPKQRDGLISIAPPRYAEAGAEITVAITHTLPREMGEQLIHVTLKDGAGKRIDRKVETRAGTGTLLVTFNVPATVKGSKLGFAAFIGPEFSRSLQHVNSKAVTLR